jgi:hypothetical protein
MHPLPSLQGGRRRPPSAARSHRRASTTAGCWRRGRGSAQGPCTRRHPLVCKLLSGRTSAACDAQHAGADNSARTAPGTLATSHSTRSKKHSKHLEGATTGGRSAPGRSAASIFTAALLPASAASSSLPVSSCTTLFQTRSEGSGVGVEWDRNSSLAALSESIIGA